jgi:hypothetical protein
MEISQQTLHFVQLININIKFKKVLEQLSLLSCEALGRTSNMANAELGVLRKFKALSIKACFPLLNCKECQFPSGIQIMRLVRQLDNWSPLPSLLPGFE